MYKMLRDNTSLSYFSYQFTPFYTNDMERMSKRITG